MASNAARWQEFQMGNTELRGSDWPSNLLVSFALFLREIRSRNDRNNKQKGAAQKLSFVLSQGRWSAAPRPAQEHHRSFGITAPCAAPLGHRPQKESNCKGHDRPPGEGAKHTHNLIGRPFKVRALGLGRGGRVVVAARRHYQMLTAQYKIDYHYVVFRTGRKGQKRKEQKRELVDRGAFIPSIPTCARGYLAYLSRP